jgi:hypothetical protein
VLAGERTCVEHAGEKAAGVRQWIRMVDGPLTARPTLPMRGIAPLVSVFKVASIGFLKKASPFGFRYTAGFS